ncbi:MAG TPA: helix-turn-helix domain-containing protein [Smithella sp.]|nr:helix-turn-helix domain-containing protein [Smithella sp.]
MDTPKHSRALLINALKDLRAAVEEEEKTFASLKNIDEMREHLEKIKKMSSEIKSIKHLISGIENRWLTIDQVAAYKDIPRKHIQEMIRSKTIGAVKRGGRWYIDRMNLEQYLYIARKKLTETKTLQLVKNKENEEK